MEGLIFVLGALVVGALGVGIGILVAPRLTRFAERSDEVDEGADGAADVPDEGAADDLGDGPADEWADGAADDSADQAADGQPGPGGRTTGADRPAPAGVKESAAIERKDEPPGDDRA